MNQSFIELPSLEDVKDLGSSVRNRVQRERPLAEAPLGAIFTAQCINHFFAYGLGLAVLLLGLASLDNFRFEDLLQARGIFWMGAGLLIWVFYFLSRIIAWIYWGRSLGECLMGIEGGRQDSLPVNAMFWESFHFIVPALWLFEMGCRMMSLRMGVPYSYSYRDS